MVSNLGRDKAMWIRVSIVLLIPGIVSIIESLAYDSTILAFVGLSLVFWGVLFLLIMPIKPTKISLLYSTSTSTYSTIDRFISDLGLKGPAYFIPNPYATTGSENIENSCPTIFISAEQNSKAPSFMDIADAKFKVEKPAGAIVTAPGLGLLFAFERKFDQELESLALDDVCKMVGKFLSQDLELAKSIEVRFEDNKAAKLKLAGSFYENLYALESYSPSVYLLGCPIVNALACVLAKTTRKTVTIQEQKAPQEGLTREVTLRLLDGAP